MRRVRIPLFSEKTCNELKNPLTITARPAHLIITQGTSQPNTDEVNETTKIVTQKNQNNLPASHQRLKETWIPIQKEWSFKQKKRVAV